MKKIETLQEESQIRQVLNSEVKFIIGIIVFVFGIVTPYYGMKQDVALIKSDISNINTNHEVHIQDLTQQIKDLNAKQIDLQNQIIAILKSK